MAYIVRADNIEFRVDMLRDGSSFKIFLDNKEIPTEVIMGDNASQLTLIIDKKLFNIVFDLENQVSVNGEDYTTEIIDEHVRKLIKAKPELIRRKELVVTAPIPGLVIEVEVKEGDQVKQGQGLMIVEAMKMQNEMKAPRDGIVKKVLVKRGQTVNSRDALVIIE